ncbi:MAG: RagB/SusD family nutrient uptake outer membrane protein [Bacteroidales bacterium]|nr:RagB/SusD family nutrient uptake outer membrane protein [Bacteroidales bacterium]
MKRLYLTAVAALAFCAMSTTSCDDMFEPAIENQRDITAMYDEPDFAQKLIGNAYIIVDHAFKTNPESDMATDDAVINDVSQNYSKMAIGGWKSDMNPVSVWDNCYNAIQYCNLLLDNCDQVKWSASDATLNSMFNDHFKAEAYALRGLFHYKLLQAHAGKVNGTLMGVPIHDKAESVEYLNQTRASFKECYDFIMADFNRALEILPYTFRALNDENDVNGVASKYLSNGKIANFGLYKRAFGEHHNGKINGKVVEALKSQLILLAASPAFEEGNTGATWQSAAEEVANVITKAKPSWDLDAKGYNWFENIGSYKATTEHSEVFWHTGSVQDNSSLEENNFPPSLYGKGQINPTQNLVDAFPMANGRPITDAASGYDPANPYDGRDNRLKAYIVCNGDSYAGGTVITRSDGTTLDALNKENKRSTRTGYYLKKLMNSNINLNPTSKNTGSHLVARIRYTELFLNFAEAANEAVGPQGVIGGHSAYEVIKKIRERAGITDVAYLDECAASKEAFRELIRNERRLELCFENKRFWDLRRWKVDLNVLNQTAKGVNITENADKSLNFNVIDVEIRDYKDYQYYGPIPYSERVKFSELVQNDSWQ